VASSAAGKLLMSADYGVDTIILDADENVMGNSERAVSGAVWNSLQFNIPSQSLRKTTTEYHKVTSQ
jgi:hypothetical protein